MLYSYQSTRQLGRGNDTMPLHNDLSKTLKKIYHIYTGDIYNIYQVYNVPLREVPRGVAQERTIAHMKYLHTCWELTACIHPSCEEHTQILLRTDYIVLLVEIVWDHINLLLVLHTIIKMRLYRWVDIDPEQITRGDHFVACGVNVITKKLGEVDVALYYSVIGCWVESSTYKILPSPKKIPGLFFGALGKKTSSRKQSRRCPRITRGPSTESIEVLEANI